MLVTLEQNRNPATDSHGLNTDILLLGCKKTGYLSKFAGILTSSAHPPFFINSCCRTFSIQKPGRRCAQIAADLLQRACARIYSLSVFHQCKSVAHASQLGRFTHTKQNRTLILNKKANIKSNILARILMKSKHFGGAVLNKSYKGY